MRYINALPLPLVFLLLFVQFWHFLKFWGNSRNPTWWIQYGRHLIILIVDLKGNIFGRTISPPSLIVTAFKKAQST